MLYDIVEFFFLKIFETDGSQWCVSKCVNLCLTIPHFKRLMLYRVFIHDMNYYCLLYTRILIFIFILNVLFLFYFKNA